MAQEVRVKPNNADRFTVGGLSPSMSRVVLAALVLFALSLLLAVWATFADGPGSSGFPSVQPTATPSSGSPDGNGGGGNNDGGSGGPDGQVGLGAPSSSRDVSASFALQPFFGDTTPNIALLVASAESLTDREQGWLDDIAFELGAAEPIEYRTADFETLIGYSTIFVIGFSEELGVDTLQRLLDSGNTIHLVGEGARYAPSLNTGSDVDTGGGASS